MTASTLSQSALAQAWQSSWQVASLLSVVLLHSACAAPGDQPATARSVDTFVLAEVPEVRIGQVSGEEPYLLHYVSDATRQSDGSIVAVNCGAADVRYFGADGTHIRTVGRRGQGPGEFQFPTKVFRLGGDTLVVTESITGRVTILGPDGTVVRTAPVGSRSGRANVFGRLADGSYVARRLDPTPSVPPGTAYRRRMTLLIMDAEGEPTDSVMGLRGWDSMSPSGPRRPTIALRLFRDAAFAVGPDRVFYGAQDSTGITVFTRDLSPIGSITPITRAAPTGEEERAAYDAMVEDGAHMPPDGIVSSTVDVYPAQMPAYKDIVAGRDGRLWVEDPIRPGVYPLTWTAYEEGDAVARVELPPRFFPFEFGSDWVLGASYDEMTVERLEVRRFVAGPLPGVRLPPRDAMPPGVPRCGAWASR